MTSTTLKPCCKDEPMHPRDAQAINRERARGLVSRAPELAALLDGVSAFVTRYVVLEPVQVIAIALWVAHAWALRAFDVTPYLAVMSPEKRSGKSRLLEILALLVPTPWKAISPSEAVVYRSIDAETPTLLLDEVDAIFVRGREQTEGLRALLNAGNARGTTVPRCIGNSHQVRRFRVFCPKVLAGIGELPDTVADRSIPIRMRRRTKSEAAHCERLRRGAEKAGSHLAHDLEAWAGDAAPAEGGALRQALLEVEHLADPDGRLATLDDRAFEQAWEPLLAIASLAGAAWYERAIEAALALSAERVDDAATLGVRLLHDIRLAFGDEARIASRALTEALVADETSPWADFGGKPLTQRALANLLRPFKIRPRSLRFQDSTAKGYEREWFADAWERYPLPEEDGETESVQRARQAPTPFLAGFYPSQPAQPSVHAGLRLIPDPSHDGSVTDRQQAANPHGYSDVTPVTDERGEEGSRAGPGALSGPPPAVHPSDRARGGCPRGAGVALANPEAGGRTTRDLGDGSPAARPARATTRRQIRGPDLPRRARPRCRDRQRPLRWAPASR
jgi:hypothetical protein